MPDLLDCLGVRGQWQRRAVAAAIWFGFAGAMVGIAAAQAIVEWVIGPSTALVALVVVLVWAGWSVWHSYLFGIHRRAYLTAGLAYPYRRAFLRDIFPGITVGFSQMLRPAWNGVNLAAGLIPGIAGSVGGWVTQLVGLMVGVASFLLFMGAWRVLGAARVGFASEFGDVARFEPVRRGPYGHVRHPLFWSGVGVSWSLALITQTTAGFVVALINTVYGLVYNGLEDRRLCGVLGDRYARYSREVPRIIPVRARPRRRARPSPG